MIPVKALFLVIALVAAAANASAQAARITLLYDAFGKPSKLEKDWGFAALIEVGDKRILFDTGNNADVLTHNVNALNVDLTRLDFVVISHRHGDHVGGLTHLLAVNPDVPIYAPREGFGVFGAELPRKFLTADDTLPPHMRYWDGAPAAQLRFGSAWPRGQFNWIGEATEVAPGFHIVALRGEWGTDLPLIELSLVIETPNGLVIVAGCSHPTIERIVATAKARLDRPIHLVVGGMHLIPAPPDELRRIALALRDEWRVNWIAPAHCTGEPAFARLRETFADRFLYAGLGTVIPLAPDLIGQAHPRAARALVYDYPTTGDFYADTQPHPPH